MGIYGGPATTDWGEIWKLLKAEPDPQDPNLDLTLYNLEKERKARRAARVEEQIGRTPMQQFAEGVGEVRDTPVGRGVDKAAGRAGEFARELPKAVLPPPIYKPLEKIVELGGQFVEGLSEMPFDPSDFMNPISSVGKTAGLLISKVERARRAALVAKTPGAARRLADIARRSDIGKMSARDVLALEAYEGFLTHSTDGRNFASIFSGSPDAPYPFNSHLAPKADWSGPEGYIAFTREKQMWFEGRGSNVPIKLKFRKTDVEQYAGKPKPYSHVNEGAFKKAQEARAKIGEASRILREAEADALKKWEKVQDTMPEHLRGSTPEDLYDSTIGDQLGIDWGVGPEDLAEYPVAAKRWLAERRRYRGTPWEKELDAFFTAERNSALARATVKNYEQAMNSQALSVKSWQEFEERVHKPMDATRAILMEFSGRKARASLEVTANQPIPNMSKDILIIIGKAARKSGFRGRVRWFDQDITAMVDSPRWKPKKGSLEPMFDWIDPNMPLEMNELDAATQALLKIEGHRYAEDQIRVAMGDEFLEKYLKASNRTPTEQLSAIAAYKMEYTQAERSLKGAIPKDPHRNPWDNPVDNPYAPAPEQPIIHSEDLPSWNRLSDLDKVEAKRWRMKRRGDE
jgi:hypothetical protein